MKHVAIWHTASLSQQKEVPWQIISSLPNTNDRDKRFYNVIRAERTLLGRLHKTFSKHLKFVFHDVAVFQMNY